MHVRGLWFGVVAVLVLGCHGAKDDEPVDSDVDDTDVVVDTDTDTDTDDTVDSDDTDAVGPQVACGEETCDGAVAFCLTELPGQPPEDSDPDYTSCAPLPAACLDDVRCGCLVDAGTIPDFADCTGDATTGLSATIAYP